MLARTDHIYFSLRWHLSVVLAQTYLRTATTGAKSGAYKPHSLGVPAFDGILEGA